MTDYSGNFSNCSIEPTIRCMATVGTGAKDSQLTELSGRHFLIAQLVAGGVEVAMPIRDRGIDLIAYLDLSAETNRFLACPIQMKASKEARFGVEQKYEKISNLLITFVWHLENPTKTRIYALTYEEAFGMLHSRGHCDTASWRDKGGYSVPNPGSSWLEELEPYRMTAERWRSRITTATNSSQRARL